MKRLVARGRKRPLLSAYFKRRGAEAIGKDLATSYYRKVP